MVRFEDFNAEDTQAGDARPLLSRTGYGHLYRKVTFATATVAVLPLVVMTFINYQQYSDAFTNETTAGIARLLTNNKRSLEFFLEERRSALSFIVRERSFAELNDPRVLSRIIRNMNDSFGMGAFIDLGLVNSKGVQLCYVGQHDLQGLDYHDQDWFARVVRNGVDTSDVFLGFRHSPHFAVATRATWMGEDYFVLRATFDAEMLANQIHSAGLELGDDIFLVNRDGVLQTPSRHHGAALSTAPFAIPPFLVDVQVMAQTDAQGHQVLRGFAGITGSPFVLVFNKPLGSSLAGGPLPKLLIFLAVSTGLILAVILWGSRQFVNNIRETNMRRAALMHKVEYHNKLASIGRLAAGVAHEINNPLAIINEKAGLLKDLVELRQDLPDRDKYLRITESVLGSVERCKRITHRLLGFAKHMDVSSEVIDIPTLLREVMGFLEKEALHRNIRIEIDSVKNVPTIESDRGQLQQVFLNLLNNAVSAVRDGGRIDISVGLKLPNMLSISISDNGIGIPKENLGRIFEPFFTTKEGSGTGLGLSITYGIVQKLGGEIAVESEPGVGTRFTVLLPLKKEG